MGRMQGMQMLYNSIGCQSKATITVRTTIFS
jgi:hypothetical protein